MESHDSGITVAMGLGHVVGVRAWDSHSGMGYFPRLSMEGLKPVIQVWRSAGGLVILSHHRTEMSAAG